MNYPKHFHCGNVVVTNIEGKTDLFHKLNDGGNLERRTRFLSTNLQDVLRKGIITEDIVYIVINIVNGVKNIFGEKCHTKSEMLNVSKSVDPKTALFSILGLMRNIGLSETNKQRTPTDLNELTEENIINGIHILFDKVENPRFDVSTNLRIYFCKGTCPDTVLSDGDKVMMKNCACQEYFQELFRLYGHKNLETVCPDHLLYLLSLFVNHSNPKYVEYCIKKEKMDMNTFVEFDLKKTLLSIDPNVANLESLFILLSSIITYMPLDYAFKIEKGLTNIFCNAMMSALHLSIFNFVDTISDLPAVETDDMNDVMTAYNYYFLLKSLMEYFVEANRISSGMRDNSSGQGILDSKMEFIKHISSIYSTSDIIDVDELKNLLETKNLKYHQYGWVDNKGRITNKFRLNAELRHKHSIITNTLHICEVIWPQLKKYNTVVKTVIKSKSKLKTADYKSIIRNNFLGLLISDLRENANIRNTFMNEKIARFWNLVCFSDEAVNIKKIKKGHLEKVWHGIFVDGTHFNLTTAFSDNYVIDVSNIELLLFELLLGGDFSLESINYAKHFFIRLLISNMCIIKQFFTNSEVFQHIFMNEDMDIETVDKTTIKTKKKNIGKLLRENVDIGLKHMNLIEPNINAVIDDIEIMVNSQSEIGIMLKLAKSLNSNMSSCKKSI